MKSRQVCIVPFLVMGCFCMSGCAHTGGFFPWANTMDESQPRRTLVNHKTSSHKTSSRGSRLARNQFGTSGVAAGKRGRDAFEGEDRETPEHGEPHPQQQQRSRFAIARLAEMRGELDRAEILYLDLLEAHPDEQRLMHRLGVVAARQGEFDLANEYFESALGAGPGNADLLADQGYSLYLQGNLTGAEPVLRTAAKMQPRNPRISNNLALVVGLRGSFDESLDLFRRNNDLAEAYANLAYVYTQRGMLDEAFDTYDKALMLDRTMESAAEAWLQVAELQGRRQRVPEQNVHGEAIAVDYLAERAVKQAAHDANFVWSISDDSEHKRPTAAPETGTWTNHSRQGVVAPVPGLVELAPVTVKVLDGSVKDRASLRDPQPFEVVRGPFVKARSREPVPIVSARMLPKEAHSSDSKRIGLQRTETAAGSAAHSQKENERSSFCPIMRELPSLRPHISLPAQAFTHTRPTWTPAFGTAPPLLGQQH